MSCRGLWRVVLLFLLLLLLLPGVIYVPRQLPCAIPEDSFIFINVSRCREGEGEGSISLEAQLPLSI